MKEPIEFTATPRRNVSERRADFYRALPDRIETGFSMEDEDEDEQWTPTNVELVVAVLALLVLTVILTRS